MNINSLQQKKIDDTIIVAIVYAKDWWHGDGAIAMLKPAVLPFDFVVCQWFDFHDGVKSNIEGMTTIAICREQSDAELIYNSRKPIRS